MYSLVRLRAVSFFDPGLKQMLGAPIPFNKIGALEADHQEFRP
ncbi:hypothetical protein O206_13480 [Ochrobactrum sp. EGD-AQ16]|nr:hypothetical protein O206_13480 [Ochrobactrum sp. EGD-AQ16]